jgi:hypothetical protein
MINESILYGGNGFWFGCGVSIRKFRMEDEKVRGVSGVRILGYGLL